MISVLIRYFITALIGAACIWFGLPILQEKAPAQYAKLEGLVIKKSAPTAKSLSGTAVQAYKSSPKDYEEDATRETAEMPLQTESENNEAVMVEASPEAENTPAEEPAAEPAEPEVVVQEEPEQPLDPRAALNEEPPYSWGVVVTNSFCYDAQMKPTGVIPGGTVIAAKSSKMLSRGLVWHCFALYNRKWQPKEYVLKDPDIVIFEGVKYSETIRDQRDAMIDFCKAYGEYEKLRGEALDALHKQNANPYDEEYFAVKDEVNKKNAELREMRRKYDETTMKVDDPRLRGHLSRKLSEMRPIMTDLQKRYTAISEKWNAWENEHAIDESSLRDTPSMQMRLRKMKQLAPIVEPLVPGLVPNYAK